MLEHVPRWLGRALAGVRAGAGALAIYRPGLVPAGPAPLALTSPAFGDGGRLPGRFTADGTGASPPLTWGPPPPGTAALVLLAEDADAPTPRPLVHALVWGLAADAGRLAEGALGPRPDLGAAQVAAGARVGRNSFGRAGWLPPDPPAGHGSHRYCFQLFALAPGGGDPGATPGRGSALRALDGRVLAAGLLVGSFGRGEEAPVGPAAAAAAEAG